MLDMKIEQTQSINISLSRYEELIYAEIELRSLIEAIYQDVSLSYDKKKLSIDSSSLENYLRVADSKRYWTAYDIVKGDPDGTDKD